ncbi:TraE/TraK family type IV conjugative transfer system protein [Ralstonia pseudosolanacearum]|uniref:TraE/TraK family type IV conjugative transfer system protein n=1 Tax=Ralstonia pseudosolanacearum TaxID=1310165 RepID=UPI003CEC2E22
MKMPLLTSSWEGANKLSGVLLVSNIILASLLAVTTISALSQHETTRMVPPGLDKAVNVGWKTADQEYLESIGLYVATLTANVTPKNVNFVADRLSQLLTPKVYQSVRQQILALAQDPVFNSNGGSVRFEATKVVSEKETQKVFVIGQMTSQSINSRDSKTSVIEMKIVMDNGRPWVDFMDHYDGGEPHTLTWAEKNPGQSQQIQKQQASAAIAAAQNPPASAPQSTSEVAQ